MGGGPGRASRYSLNELNPGPPSAGALLAPAPPAAAAASLSAFLAFFRCSFSFFFCFSFSSFLFLPICHRRSTGSTSSSSAGASPSLSPPPPSLSASGMPTVLRSRCSWRVRISRNLRGRRGRAVSGARPRATDACGAARVFSCAGGGEQRREHPPIRERNEVQKGLADQGVVGGDQLEGASLVAPLLDSRLLHPALGLDVPGRQRREGTASRSRRIRTTTPAAGPTHRRQRSPCAGEASWLCGGGIMAAPPGEERLAVVARGVRAQALVVPALFVCVNTHGLRGLQRTSTVPQPASHHHHAA